MRLVCGQVEASSASAWGRPIGVWKPKALEAYQVHLETKGNVASRGPKQPHRHIIDACRRWAVFATEIIITGEPTPVGDACTGSVVSKRLNDSAQGMVRAFQCRECPAWGLIVISAGIDHADVLAGIEVSGKRKKGKPKLTQDEAHQLVSWCLAHPDDPGDRRDRDGVSPGHASVRDRDPRGPPSRRQGHAHRHHRREDRGWRAHAEASREAPATARQARRGEDPQAAALRGPDSSLGPTLGEAMLRGCRRPGRQPSWSSRHPREDGPGGRRPKESCWRRPAASESETTTTEHYAGRAAVANAAIDRVARLVH